MWTVGVMAALRSPWGSFPEAEAGPSGPGSGRAVALHGPHAPASLKGAEPDRVVGGRGEPRLGHVHLPLLLLRAVELLSGAAASLAGHLEVVGRGRGHRAPREQQNARIVLEDDAIGRALDRGRCERPRRQRLLDGLLAVARVPELQRLAAIVDDDLGGVPLAGLDVEDRPV